jgi:hypothetical protein
MWLLKTSFQGQLIPLRSARLVKQKRREKMLHQVWSHDLEIGMTLRKPQEWNFCRYCGAQIEDTHNVPCCDNCYPAYRHSEQELYLHQHDVLNPQPRFDPQTGTEGSETFQPSGWKYLDTTGGYQHIRDFPPYTTATGIRVEGEIIAASWSIALYQRGKQYILAAHRDFECTEVRAAWFIDPLTSRKVREELEASQLDRMTDTPTIDAIMKKG